MCISTLADSVVSLNYFLPVGPSLSVPSVISSALMARILLLANLLTAVAAAPPPDTGGGECQLPAEHGPCRATFRRYYFNWDSQTCEEFTYGGNLSP
jgi:hypothetical protein